MAKSKITMNLSITMEDLFDDFILSKRAKGLQEKTITTYKQHFSAISKFLQTKRAIEEINKSLLEKMVSDMREAALSSQTIRSYTSTLKNFLTWCNEENITMLNIKLYKAEETLKETYTDEELEALLQKPNMRKCLFSEYRTWVIINLLVNNGCRAATIRNIQIRDVDLINRVIYLRHTKNKKAQAIPLCEMLVSVLKEYMRIRGGDDEDYLFPNERGAQLTENGLRCSIAKYNKRRGVQKTSIHSFRHTFAKKYLVDCGGNAFTLQRLLGHSTLDMTKHYCAIFDADIAKDYDHFSPLMKMQSNSERIKMPKRR